jgi:hypothetical protein
MVIIAIYKELIIMASTRILPVPQGSNELGYDLFIHNLATG